MKNQTHTHTQLEREREREFFFGGVVGQQYIASLMEASVFHVSAHFTVRGRAIGVTTAPPIGTSAHGKLWLFFSPPQLSVFSLPSQIKTCSAENQIKDASPWQIARLIIYLGKHKRKDARERKRHRRRDTGGMAKWQRSLISGTWLYNWALIDTKSIPLAHDVSYTCCRPQAGCVWAISVPSPDWCLSVKCPSAICTHNRSTSISVEHLLPSIHPPVISPFCG